VSKIKWLLEPSPYVEGAGIKVSEKGPLSIDTKTETRTRVLLDLRICGL
jgi:hypothetical protein